MRYFKKRKTELAMIKLTKKYLSRSEGFARMFGYLKRNGL